LAIRRQIYTCRPFTAFYGPPKTAFHAFAEFQSRKGGRVESIDISPGEVEKTVWKAVVSQVRLSGSSFLSAPVSSTRYASSSQDQ
jgi:hypothetical protein